MILPKDPTCEVTAIAPQHGYDGRVFRLSEPVVLADGVSTCYVLTSWGLETLVGEDNFAVFACNELGRVLSWEAIYDASEGPDWAAQLASATQLAGRV